MKKNFFVVWNIYHELAKWGYRSSSLMLSRITYIIKKLIVLLIIILKINIGVRNHIHGSGFYNLFLFDVYFVNFVFLKLLATFDLYFRKIYQHSKPFSNPFLWTQKLVQNPLQLIKWSTSMCSGTLHSTVNVGVKLELKELRRKRGQLLHYWYSLDSA